MNPSEQIDNQIKTLADWRGEVLKQLRSNLHEVDPDIVEEWKWGTAVWSHNGLVCAFAGMKDKIKINFFKGASLKDPSKLFNAGLEAKATRAIDLYEEDKLDNNALKELLKEAIEYNKNNK